MQKFKLILLTFVITACCLPGFSQELNCVIQVNSQKVKTVDRKIFDSFQESVFEFMNNRKWSTETFEESEKIECSIFITINEELGNDLYSAIANIQLSRPVFNSDYNSTILNLVDRDLIFKYIEFQPLEYSENAFISALTSTLAFYAYIFIGMDYDCFTKTGGSVYLSKAESILNTIPSGSGSPKGWKPFDGQRNRYWLITDMLNPRYSSFREAYYQYHLQGLDQMYEKPDVGRTQIMGALQKIQKFHEEKPTSYLINIFLAAKSDEIGDIFSQAPNPDKTKVINIMAKIDPTNVSKYTKKILGK